LKKEDCELIKDEYYLMCAALIGFINVTLASTDAVYLDDGTEIKDMPV
jgi:hypothetical protein